VVGSLHSHLVGDGFDDLGKISLIVVFLAFGHMGRLFDRGGFLMYA